MNPAGLAIIEASWEAPARVRALTTTRRGGVSAAPFDALNLAAHVGDDPGAVTRNRERLVRALGLPESPRWLRQVHGARVIDAARIAGAVEADGSWTDRPGVVCAVLTADCLPLFLCDAHGARVGVLHVGWRGLAAGVVEAGVAALGARGARLLAWLGPAIGPEAFEVGPDVRAALGASDAKAFREAGRPGRWHFDLAAAVRARLERLGVRAVCGPPGCTYRRREDFFSYRRDGVCGRMASLIWIDVHRARDRDVSACTGPLCERSVRRPSRPHRTRAVGGARVD